MLTRVSMQRERERDTLDWFILVRVHDQTNLITWATFWHSRGARIPPAVYKPLSVQLWQRTLKRQVTRSTDALNPSWTSSSTTNLNERGKRFVDRTREKPTPLVYPYRCVYLIERVSAVVGVEHQQWDHRKHKLREKNRSRDRREDLHRPWLTVTNSRLQL